MDTLVLYTLVPHVTEHKDLIHMNSAYSVFISNTSIEVTAQASLSMSLRQL